MESGGSIGVRKTLTGTKRVPIIMDTLVVQMNLKLVLRVALTRSRLTLRHRLWLVSGANRQGGTRGKGSMPTHNSRRVPQRALNSGRAHGSATLSTTHHVEHKGKDRAYNVPET